MLKAGFGDMPSEEGLQNFETRFGAMIGDGDVVLELVDSWKFC